LDLLIPNTVYSVISEFKFILTLRPVFLPGGNSYNGLYREAPIERGTFFMLQVFLRVGVSQAEVYEGVGKSVI